MESIMHRGGCLCGGVRLTIDGPLAPIQVCHCGQCRKAQGGPFGTNIPVERSALRIESGEALLKSYASSPGKRRVFCSVCGSPLYSERDALPGVVRLRAGLLDEPVATLPALHQYLASRCSWWEISDGLPQYPAGLPAKA
jgi:hypothetical protein